MSNRFHCSLHIKSIFQQLSQKQLPKQHLIDIYRNRIERSTFKKVGKTLVTPRV